MGWNEATEVFFSSIALFIVKRYATPLLQNKNEGPQHPNSKNKGVVGGVDRPWNKPRIFWRMMVAIGEHDDALHEKERSNQ